MLTKEQRKEKAIEIMTRLNIYKPYIAGYKTTTRYVSMSASVGTGYTRSPKLKQRCTSSSNSTTSRSMLLHTSLPNSASFGASFTCRTMEAITNTHVLTALTAILSVSHTFGTKRTTGAANSDRLRFAVSAAGS